MPNAQRKNDMQVITGGPVESGNPMWWRWLSRTLTGLGVAGALVSMHPATLLASVVLCLAVATGFCCTAMGEQRLYSAGHAAWLRTMGAIAASSLAAVGVLATAGGPGLLLWASLLGGGWLLLRRPRWCAQTLPAPSGPSADDRALSPRLTEVSGAAEVDLPQQAGDVASLSDTELCWAWRNSYFAAQHAAADPHRLEQISGTRRAYLDEIQRRDPRGFATWLNAGARAASNPARYWRTEA